MRFRINNNGNSAKDIHDRCMAVVNTTELLVSLMSQLRAEAFHPRNYQTLEHGAALREADMGEAEGHVRALLELQTWAALGVHQTDRR